MTLIIAAITQRTQLLVADRLVSWQSGAIHDDAAYKIILYVNSRQAYRAGVAFTGLAAVNGNKTADWLCHCLPRAMDSETRIDLAISRLGELCTQEIAYPGARPVHLTFVIAGRFNPRPDASATGQWIPFLAVVSNSVGEGGQQLDQAGRRFAAYSTRLLRRSQSLSLCRGDLRPQVHSRGDLRILFRYLRRDRLHAGAKAALAARYIRGVATKSRSVGEHILGLAILSHQESVGYDLSVDPVRATRTMPHLVTDGGTTMTDFRVTEYRG